MKNLALLLSVALFLSGCTLFSGQSTPITGTEAQKAEKLAAILASGGQADCTITNLEDKSTTRMVVSGKKMKIVGSDFGEGKKGTMINDSVYSYIWTEGEKTGIKTKLDPDVSPTPTVADRTDTSDTVASPETYEDETKYQTDCQRTSVPDSEFTPPADVIFTDLSEMMRSVPTIPQIPSRGEE